VEENRKKVRGNSKCETSKKFKNKQKTGELMISLQNINSNYLGYIKQLKKQK